MSTVPTYRDLNAIRSRLWAVRDRWRFFLILRGFLALGALVLGLVLLVALGDTLFHLPVWARIVLLLVSAAGLGVALVIGLVRPAFRRLGEEEVARHIEQAVPDVRNGLINAIQLARDRMAPSTELVDRAITEAAVESASKNLNDAIDSTWLKRLGTAAAVLVAMLLVFQLLFPGKIGNALQRVLMPTDTTVAYVGRVQIISVTPSESPVKLVFGDPLEVKVLYRSPGGERVEATLVWTYASGEERRADMSPVDAEGSDPSVRAALHRIEAIEVPMTFFVKVGDSESARVAVKVLPRPRVENVDLEYDYPDYTGLENHTEVGSVTGNIEAPVGTYVTVSAHVNVPVAGGEMRLAGEKGGKVKLTPDLGGRTISGRLHVQHDANYAFYLSDANERPTLEVSQRQIRAIPDRKPSAAVVAPPEDTSVPPGETLRLAVRVTDDYGIEKVTLHLKRNDEKPVTLKTWTTFDDPKTDTLSYALELDAASYKSGEVLSISADVRDNCKFGRQEATSPVRRITIRDREEERRQLTEDMRDWKARLEKVLRTQQKARAAAATLSVEMNRADFANRAGGVEKDQLSIYQETITLSDDMSKLKGEPARVVRITLAVLARNEMLKAVQLSGSTAKLRNLSELAAPRGQLLALQDKIIDTLRKVLDILPEIEKEKLGEEDGRESTEMPQDASKKWKDLAEKLKEFVDQQKKVIAQTEDLAKKPVDDFGRDDEEKLKELAAVEDEWSKFMKELHKDLSKLPNQDFSNPSLLKELLEVQSDVEKAADALTRKEIELAVPIEQAGVENAEELITHIEKWLPDSADRDQWKMEEPVEDLETPMAELPKELEDIVGDLMEDEEDLFEEIEDASSAWSDSLDKGAGWDAMDGPISNMSAQGVTGNRLPNSSEIGGRSGEGRTGKSGGEMVEEEATGKGGRRTPTRLTPDPYEKGEVKDSANEPAGGSTGGGKVSGASAEGLEGPVPPALAKKMQRLAGKQSDLRNKAERLALGYKVLNYDPSDVRKIIDHMKDLEDDLRNYRYRNVLRRRQIVLKGLDTVRLMLRNQVTVSKDYSATLPTEVQKEIMDTAEHELPEEYRDLVQKYYESLSKE